MLTELEYRVYSVPGRPGTDDPPVLYVGETSKSLADRRASHIYSARAGKAHPVLRWIRQHGAHAFHLNLEAVCAARDTARKLEAELVRKYRPPLNATPDGGGAGAEKPGGPDRRARRVVDLDTGERWPSQEAVARALNRARSTVHYALSGIHETCAGRRLAYA